MPYVSVTKPQIMLSQCRVVSVIYSVYMFQLPTLRGCVLEDAIPASGRLSSSRGLPVKDLLEFVVPDLQSSCLRQATAGQKTSDQLMKLDEQRVRYNIK